MKTFALIHVLLIGIVACSGVGEDESVPIPDIDRVGPMVANAAARPACTSPRFGVTVATADDGALFRCVDVGGTPAWDPIPCGQSTYGVVAYSSQDAQMLVCTRFAGGDRWTLPIYAARVPSSAGLLCPPTGCPR